MRFHAGSCGCMMYKNYRNPDKLGVVGAMRFHAGSCGCMMHKLIGTQMNLGW